jgi:uncharacterized protein
MMLMLGSGVAKDEAKAISLLTQACDAGVAAGCYNLGVLHAGRGVARSVAAVRLFDKSCALGEAAACQALGAAHETGQGGVAVDETKSAELYRRGCDQGASTACNALARMLHLGRGVAKDPAEEALLYARACEGDDVLAC